MDYAFAGWTLGVLLMGMWLERRRQRNKPLWPWSGGEAAAFSDDDMPESTPDPRFKL